MLKCKFTCKYVFTETASDYSKYDLILILVIIQATVHFRFIIMINNYYYYYDFVIGRFV